MSDLQITLIALGAIIILCVLLYNWWQERKFRLNMASSFKEPKRDLLIDEFEINTDTITIHADAFEKHHARQPIRPREELVSIELERVELELASQVAAPIVIETPLPPHEPIENMATAIDRSPEELLIESFHSAAFNSQQADVEASTDDDSKVEGDLDIDIDESSAHDAEQSPILVESATDSLATPHMASTIETGVETPLAELIAPAPINLPNIIDQKIDLVTLINLEQGLGQQLGQDAFKQALNELLEVLDELDKPVYVFGLDAKGDWHLIANDRNLTQNYTQLSLSLQLADRGGAVSKANLNRFQHAVEMLGATLDCPVEWLSNSSLEFAQQLDQFCITVDKIIGFHLVQGESGAFHGTKLKGLAEANGFSLGKDGAFHYSAHYSEPYTQESNNSELNTQVNTENEPLFSIIHHNNQLFTSENLRSIVIKGITFQMDIPRVKNCAEAFKQMVAIAQKMQISLGAYLVDDNQKPLAASQIDKIYQQLEGIQATMLKHGIASGSPTALRLFV